MFDTIPDGWVALLLLGAFHGVNPGMGWLFAVALGLQEGTGRGVWRALPPLVAGHALAVTAAVVVGSLIGLAVGAEAVRWMLAGLLVGMGVLHFRRAWHPRFGGMRVSRGDLVVWSFLMATGHGAGLMALAFVPMGDGAGPSIPAATPHMGALPAADGLSHAGHLSSAAGGDAWAALLASLVHTAGYLLVTGLLATLVFYYFGLRLLRRGWVNLDLVWSGALVVTGVVILFV